jgi:Sigma-70, region 4
MQMIRLEQLPPDQRAVLSLLLRQRKSYEQVAVALGIAPETVAARAHSALAVLAPAQARPLDPAERRRIGDYLLGQQSDQDAAQTKSYLAGSTPAREWARALAVELVKLAAAGMPEIPEVQAQPSAEPQAQPSAQPEAQAQPSAQPQAQAQQPSADPKAPVAPTPLTPPAATGESRPQAPISRRGGAILLGGIVVIVAAVVAIVLGSGGGGGKGDGSPSNSSSTSAEAGACAVSSQAAGGSSGKVRIEKLAEMKPLAKGSSAAGYAAIVAKGTEHAVEIEASKLAPTNGFSYVVWLTGDHGQPSALGRVPSVGAHGHFRVIEALAEAPSAVCGIEISRETKVHPSTPSVLVLKGRFVGS